MDTFSDRMSTFAQEVLTRFADELPEETFGKVSDIVLRELQYQQIQEKIYVPLKEFLEALQKNSDTNKKIIKRIDTMLTGNVQQLQRDEKQMRILQDVKKEQLSLEESVRNLSTDIQSEFQDNLMNGIKDECREIVQNISQKMENATVQYNKDNTNISNQIGMLVEIHKQFMDEFKNSDVTSAIEKATAKLEYMQQESMDKVSWQLERIPNLIQSEVMEAIDQQEILDTLKEQQSFISERLDKAEMTPSLEESQMLLQPIQDAMLDQGGQIETMLHNLQESIAELQVEHAQVASESTGEEAISIDGIEQRIVATFEPIIAKLEDALLENIRPKDLDTMKKSLSKMMETGFWRIEQLVESGAVSSQSDRTPSVQNSNVASQKIEEQLLKIEAMIEELSSKNSVQEKLQEYTQSIAKYVVEDIKETFSIANLKETLSIVDDKLDSLAEKVDNAAIASEEYYQKLQQAILNVENKVLGLAIELDTKKEPKISITCPHCTKEVTGSASMEGQRVMCRHCKEEFTFPKP